MSTTTPPPATSSLRGGNRLPDKLFQGASVGSGVFIVALVSIVGIYLLATSLGAIQANKVNPFGTNEWNVADPANMRFGILGLLWTTVISSIVAMLIAVPVAVGVALFLTQYAPKKLAAPFAQIIDLLAAVPSIIFGIWGITVLAPYIRPLQDAISSRFDFIPLLKDEGISTGTVFMASIVLAIMILPIVTAISREVFAQVPRAHIEAALALGATKWEVIKTAVWPFGIPGVISAAMLGLGRALGETVAVMIILSAIPRDNFSLSLFNGGETFASKIATSAGEFDTALKTGSFIFAGLVLFVLTFAVNAVARIVIERRKAFVD